MTITASTARQFTIDDLANLPDDGNRYEVIEGELYMSAAPGDNHQGTVLALSIEILSPGATNIERDRETKLTLYSRRAVREYWIVDPVRRDVEVYRRTAGQLQLVGTVLADETLTSPHLADFALPVADLFAEIDEPSA
ncbi:MAG: Uma2 family endonuclease [Chloroflexi bacterium]|nr:Uma2 family endonuclease [Chloroflexota bacterium]